MVRPAVARCSEKAEGARCVDTRRGGRYSRAARPWDPEDRQGGRRAGAVRQGFGQGFGPMRAGCAFCRIGEDPSGAVVLHAEAGLVVVLDHMPIRPGHCMILPRAHYPYFDDLPTDLAHRSMTLAQDIARAMKAVYGVERVAFFATGTDIAHAHLHLVPMHDRTDLTSARYMTAPPAFRRPEIAARGTLAVEADRIRAQLEAGR